MKSAVAKPVVVIMLLTWKNAWCRLSPALSIMGRMFQAMARPEARKMPKYHSTSSSSSARRNWRSSKST